MEMIGILLIGMGLGALLDRGLHALVGQYYQGSSATLPEPPK